jgi:hypothetical protein
MDGRHHDNESIAARTSVSNTLLRAQSLTAALAAVRAAGATAAAAGWGPAAGGAAAVAAAAAARGGKAAGASAAVGAEQRQRPVVVVPYQLTRVRGLRKWVQGLGFLRAVAAADRRGPTPAHTGARPAGVTAKSGDAWGMCAMPKASSLAVSRASRHWCTRIQRSSPRLLGLLVKIQNWRDSAHLQAGAPLQLLLQGGPGGRRRVRHVQRQQRCAVVCHRIGAAPQQHLYAVPAATGGIL